MSTQTQRLDAVIIGAGPAGASAASWLAQLGLRAVVLERGPEICAALATLRIEHDSVLGAPQTSLANLRLRYGAHLAALPGVTVHTGLAPTALRCLPGGGWQVQAGAVCLETRCLVLATGLKPRRPAAYFGKTSGAERTLDALSLTQQRDALAPGHALLLGGGDNAAENALYLAERGHSVTVWTRSGWRAQPGLLARLKSAERICLREGEALPHLQTAEGEGAVVVSSRAHGVERFDMLAVLFGYEPDAQAFKLVQQALCDAGLPCPVDDLSCQLPEAPAAGLFVAGDASGRWHPCVQTALADGVTVAKRVQERVWQLLTPERAHAVLAPTSDASRARGQVLRLSGLRCDARLGWLDREKRAPQPIEVDAEINMGPQPLLPNDDDLSHVLDYRKVRQIIIDECNAVHTHLIETLLGKLCLRLSRLPGVLGVRVQVTKLEIFDDCRVAMSAQHGQW